MPAITPQLYNVRGFKDEPEHKLLDSSNQKDRDDFKVYILDSITPSMYQHGDHSEPIQNTPNTVGDKFFDDSLVIDQLVRANPITIEAAAQSNGNWHYCYLTTPYLRTGTNFNLITFPDQEYVVSNDGGSSIYVYIRRYDKNGGHNVVKPVVISPGQTARF